MGIFSASRLLDRPLLCSGTVPASSDGACTWGGVGVVQSLAVAAIHDFHVVGDATLLVGSQPSYLDNNAVMFCMIHRCPYNRSIHHRRPRRGMPTKHAANTRDAEPEQHPHRRKQRIIPTHNLAVCPLKPIIRNPLLPVANVNMAKDDQLRPHP